MSDDLKSFRFFIIFGFAVMGYIIGAIISSVLGVESWNQMISTACSVTAALLVFEGTQTRRR